jgi:putative zinc finger protein
MTHEHVQELLPEFLLGSLDDVATADVRRHLRGCASCREEQDRLEEGIDALSRAAHDTAPPEDLRPRVLQVLGEEWDEEPAAVPQPVAAPSPPPRRRLASLIAVAAAVVLVAVSLTWGVAQHRRASLAATDAASYRTILSTLGGKDFRLGSLGGDGWEGLTGQIVVYDGDAEHGWSSWALVFLQSDADPGDVTAHLVAADGRTIALPTMSFRDGEARTWLVTHEDLTRFDELTITGPDGLLATTRIRDA